MVKFRSASIDLWNQKNKKKKQKNRKKLNKIYFHVILKCKYIKLLLFY